MTFVELLVVASGPHTTFLQGSRELSLRTLSGGPRLTAHSGFGLTATGHACLTRVVEHSVDEGAVAEKCVAGCDVLEITFLKQGVLKDH